MKRSASALGTICLGVLAAWAVFARTESPSTKLQNAPNQGANYTVRMLALPDNNAGDVSMDYIAYDPGSNSVWVPGGNTGAVDVVDVATDKVRQIPGFPTKEVEVRAGKRVFGPTAVSIGTGFIYIGNRGDSTVCAFNSTSLAKAACDPLDSTPHAAVYVAPTK